MQLLGFYNKEYNQFINISAEIIFDIVLHGNTINIEMETNKDYIDRFFSDDINDVSAVVSDSQVDKSLLLNYIHSMDNSSLTIYKNKESIYIVEPEYNVIVTNKTKYEYQTSKDIGLDTFEIVLCNNIQFQNIKSDNVLLLINDNIIGSHPQVQKSFLYNIIKNVESSLNGKEVQIIITTDSPFILSDFPKNHVIFLTGSNGKNVFSYSKHNSMSQTFGQNIHTLLTESFFIEGGLIGDNGREQLNKIVSFIRDDNNFTNSNDSKIDNVIKKIQMIGEPVIRNKLNSMITEQIDKHLPNRVRIKQIEKELTTLQGELNKL